MVTRIQKWGNSLGLRIPKSFASEAQVAAGAEVNLTVEKGRLVISPLKPRQYALSYLLKKVTTGNIHSEIWNDFPSGKELL